MKASFDPSWEQNIYSQSRQINRYAYSDLVGHVLSLYGPRLRAGHRMRALELGSGAGNNLAFLAREGFETHGIDGSATACRAAREFLRTQSLSAEIVEGDFISLPYPGEHFDLVVDRAAVYCNRKAAIEEITDEVRRCLIAGGRFISFVFARDHGSASDASATVIEPGTYRGFTSGPFADSGTVHLFSRDEIVTEYMRGLEIEFLYYIRKDSLIPLQRNEYTGYLVCGRKP